MKKVLYTALSATLLFTVACTNDQGKKMNHTQEDSKVQGYEPLKDTDMDFIRHAGHGNAAEASMGKLAAEKAMAGSIRQFGEMMSTDHTGALNELKEIGTRLNVQVPVTGDEKQMDKEHDLAQLSGVEFDKEYVKCQVDEHEKTVKLFEDEIKNGTHPDLIAYANKHLPTIRHHLEKAKALKESVK